MRTPVVKAFSLGMIAGSFLTAGTLVFAFPAKAEPDASVVAYAATYGAAVCSVLDDYPTISGVIGIGQAITEDGFSMYQAGQVIGLSVLEICPRHTGLMNRFMDAFDEQAVA